MSTGNNFLYLIPLCGINLVQYVRTSKVRDAIVVPGLKRNLRSISKFSEAGYTTIFHPGEGGVSIHGPNTFQITTTTPPILQGCKSKGL
jgi:hypothetical protein